MVRGKTPQGHEFTIERTTVFCDDEFISFALNGIIEDAALTQTLLSQRRAEDFAAETLKKVAGAIITQSSDVEDEYPFHPIGSRL